MAAELRLRPAQQEILRYKTGRLGVSAVPGSGKTFTLSLLAAQLVQRLAGSGPFDGREVLVVTFTNAAVENFRASINQFIQSKRLLPGGFRVRTLHSLAYDIVRERPDLVGLSEDFDIVDDRTSQEMKRQAVNRYLRNHPDVLSGMIKPDQLSNRTVMNRQLPEVAQDVAEAVIRRAKDLRTGAATLKDVLNRQSGTWPLLLLGLQVLEDYQRGLAVRGGVDFNDLILLALQALEADGSFLARLQQRWPYVLEDEAQDSSPLQEQMLKLLSAAHGNWVRVGDPNQSINASFTSADPKYLRQFVSSRNVKELPLPNSGRSALPIIDLANQLIDWTRQEHPFLSRESALAPPHILPTGANDPQANPPPGDPAVFFHNRALTPDQEVRAIQTSLRRWLPDNSDKTVAVLVPYHFRGDDFRTAFDQASIPYNDVLLRSSRTTRNAIDALATLLRFVSQPHKPEHLQDVWTNVWWPRRGQLLVATHPHMATFMSPLADTGNDGRPTEAAADQASQEEAGGPKPVQTFSRALGQLRQPERFLFPAAGDDWLNVITWIDDYQGFRPLVEAFRTELKRWTEASELPVDELVLTLGQDLFVEPAELALAHGVAVHLAGLVRDRPDLRLHEIWQTLRDIGQNSRRFFNFVEDAYGFEPPAGEVTIATMHAAKGLEWDRVYLTSLSEYDFPGGGDDDMYRGERWYVRDSLNLTAEALAQTEQLHMGTLDEFTDGQATRQARREVAAERLRLLYVGITRARRELILTYNTGRNHERRANRPALAFTALEKIWRNSQARG
ncbi:MAG: ATP-dependent helicase [Caldilineaceae bacterium]|nr:ATP-dependent helicase [Caldilineaceae bacterium]